jgi:hypothetical protein
MAILKQVDRNNFYVLPDGKIVEAMPDAGQ